MSRKHEGTKSAAHASNQDQWHREEETFDFRLENLTVSKTYHDMRCSLRDGKNNREDINKNDSTHCLVRMISYPKDEKIKVLCHLFEVKNTD
jgi:hypothetical protein